MRATVPRLIGVIHLPPLPGSPRYAGDFGAITRQTAAEARLLEAAGYDGIIVENFGDAPFFPTLVPPVTVAAMTATTTARRSTAVIAPATSRPGATSAASPSVAKTSRYVHAGSANRRRGQRCNVRLRARVRQHR